MIELIPLVAFPLLRMLDGADKISRTWMCLGMAIASTGGWQSLNEIIHIAVMFPALLWVFSYGWSLSAIHGDEPMTDWDMKFAPSGDFLSVVYDNTRWLERMMDIKSYRRILGALGWMPRIFMTFWLPCAVAGNVWAVIPLALLWGWCYYLGGVIGRLVKRDIGTRIGEGLSALMLAWALA